MKKYLLITIIFILPFMALAQFTTDDLLVVRQKDKKFPSVRVLSYEETPGATSGYGYLSMYNYGGVLSAPKPTLKNRYLGRVFFGGHNGDRPINVGNISVLTKDNFTNDNYPSRMDFRLGGTAGSRLRMSIDSETGNVGIGTHIPRNKLDVNGTIRSREVRVEASPWPDFVFEENYKFPTLIEIEGFIKENQHLPGIPSANEVAEHGIVLGEMSANLLQKIEELTLYAIEQDKEIKELKIQAKEIPQLKKENELLKSLLQRVSILEQEIKNKN